VPVPKALPLPALREPSRRRLPQVVFLLKEPSRPKRSPPKPPRSLVVVKRSPWRKKPAKPAKEATVENERLQGELARKDRIILEKVASVAPKADPAAVTDLVNSMVSHGLAQQKDASILIEQLTAHPDNVVKLAKKLVVISMPAPAQGRGVAKEASASNPSDSAHDEWRKVIEEGA
jgi:hypothetical protein